MRPQVHLDLYPNVNNLITDNHAFIKSRYLFLFSSLEYYLVHGIKPPNHQFCYPQFFHEFFYHEIFLVILNAFPDDHIICISIITLYTVLISIENLYLVKDPQ